MLAKPFLKDQSLMITKKSLENMFIESTLVSEKQIEAGLTLITYAQIWIGVNTANVSDLLINKSVEYLLQKFPEITFQDIRNGFEDDSIEKIPFVQLTIEELVGPVKRFMTKKNVVLNEMKQIEKEMEKEKQNEQLEKEFKEFAKQKYLKALETGIIDLDVNECNAIVENQKHLFIEEELAKLRPIMIEKANYESKRLKVEAENDPMKLLIIPSLKRLSGMYFIHYCLEQRKNFVEM